MNDVPHSVLVHPDQSCLLFVDFVTPLKDDADIDRQSASRRAYLELLQVATKLSVPIFASARLGDMTAASDEALDGYLSRENRLSRSAINPWKDKRLRNWIFDLDRNRLVLAGGYSEGSLMQGALSALQDMYDVYVLFDLSDRRLVSEGSPMAQRMIQHGVVPLTTRQLLLEWAAAANGEDEVSSE
ncbi:MAG: hypothetical protein AAFW97_08540 [Pseudomonadota bacterium]